MASCVRAQLAWSAHPRASGDPSTLHCVPAFAGTSGVAATDSLAPTRPIRLFARPEPIEAIAEVPDGPPVQFTWRRVQHEVAHAEGPERIAMEWWRDDAGQRAHARLFPRREPRGRARLALPRRLVRSGGDAAAAGSCTACSHEQCRRVSGTRAEGAQRTTPDAPRAGLCRAGRHHQFLLPARRVASGRTGASRPWRSALPASASRTATAWPAWCAPIRRDRSTRTHDERRTADRRLKLAVGARLVFADGTPDILAYPQDRAAWGRLTRLLTVGKSRAEKGRMHSASRRSARAHRGAQSHRDAAGADRSREARSGAVLLATLEMQTAFRAAPSGSPPACSIAATTRAGSRGSRRSPTSTCVPLIAVNDVLYHAPERRPLQDVVTCIREHVTIDTAGRLLEANAERHLKAPQEMARLFRRAPEAIEQTLRFLDRCNFSLDELQQHRISGREPRAAMRRRRRRWSHLPRKARADAIRTACRRKSAMRSTDELELTAELEYAPYLPHRARHRQFRALARASCARAAARRRIRSSAIASASPRSIPRRSISCSSASSPRSGASRPTSTSISSTSGARR